MATPQTFTSLQVMQDAPVIPVIVLNDVAHAVPMARALVAGGIRMLEVTLRTPQALACIEAIARDVPEAVVGAGTVRTKADAQAAAHAGSRFAVSPGYTSAVGQACRDAGLALLPGVASGSEIMMAQEDGFTELKFFPAMQAGGPAMLKAWSGPFSGAAERRVRRWLLAGARRRGGVGRLGARDGLGSGYARLAQKRLSVALDPFTPVLSALCELLWSSDQSGIRRLGWHSRC
jgi:2-dehydro-3-deoxyphosphogluconate aldolase/(4S)-4-hydroxy-2-oxoglutarate aldolase